MDYKELTIEQKAKRYDEILARAKGANIPYYKEDTMSKVKEFVDYLLPELKDSEDEEIRYYLINFVKINDGVNLPPDDAKKAIAWLEKQGVGIDKLVKYREWLISETERWHEKENDKTNSKAGKHCCIGEANAFISARAKFEEIFDYESWPEKQGEPKPAENKGMNLVEEEMTPFQKKVFFIIDTAIEEEQGLKQVCDELLRLAHYEIMQNPAWSEEDEWKFSDILALLRGGENFHYNTPELFDWLKSLKDRYTWKPSDEQMEALLKLEEMHVLEHEKNQENAHLYMAIKSLKEQLWKLKGEII